MTEYLKTAQVAKELKIKPSTLRKYAILLERYDYTFPRNYANQRMYRPEHIEMFKNMQMTKDNPKLTLVEAAKILTMDYREEEQSSVVIPLEEWETLKKKCEAMGRSITALFDIVEKLGAEVFRGRMNDWDGFINEVYAEYFTDEEDAM